MGPMEGTRWEVWVWYSPQACVGEMSLKALQYLATHAEIVLTSANLKQFASY